ncbi:hypothetical protein AMS68_005542 [Peltaster fructicola]|uniref:DnaJ homolog 1, mitochondrial n=1 Tax=Peltaster fructicola TaxID=286661 RepID=A0A6H0XZD1_9PEZI|nr:hypothetical protein AMS68_005542 [Peltaster fructicola]
MPPAKIRTGALADDSRSDISGTKERQNNTGAYSRRGKGPGASAPTSATRDHGSTLKELALISTESGEVIAPGQSTGMNWTTVPAKMLDNYRIAYDISAPASFTSPLNQALLTTSGIARQSPTMARRKEKRPISRDQLATSVRKHFNGAAVSEIDVVVQLAYKVKHQTFHTNKEPTAKERFAEAQSAYELLNDPKKKEAWDQYGSAAFDQGAGFDPSGGAQGGNPFGAGGPFAGFGGAAGFGGFGGGGAQGGFSGDINFDDIFSAFGGARRGRGGSRPFQEEIMVGDNIEVQASISFMDAAKGTKKELKINTMVQCGTCGGAGLKKGIKKDTCKSCDGTGTRVHFMQGGFQMASTCSTCGGQGVVIPRGSECNTCRGHGSVREKTTVTVEIPGGVEDGMRLRVMGEGDYPATGQAANPNARAQRGDLYVFIKVEPDRNFQRSGSDVLYSASIPLTTAVLGGEIDVPTLGDKVRVRVPRGTSHGDTVTMSGMGMKKLNSRRPAFGDLRVAFKITMPRSLSVNQKTLLEMLADEFDDKSATRTMNLKQYRQDASSGTSSDGKPTAPPGHEEEGFLKNFWHNITGQHGQPDSDKSSKPDDKKPQQNEEPKKAAGSG